MDAIEIMKTYKKWAVVGATAEQDKYGYKIHQKLLSKDHEVYPVNPKYSGIEGNKVYPSLNELPQKPDIVVFVVNPIIGIGILKDCIKLGIKKIWLQPGTISNELLTLAKENDIEAIKACVLVVGNY